MIRREIQKYIVPMLGSQKAIIIMGARQVGKSTLLQQLLGGRSDVMWLNGDEDDVREMFHDISSSSIS